MRHRHIMEMRSEMKYIESLREGERINEIYLCKVKQSALTKAGKPYDNLILHPRKDGPYNYLQPVYTMRNRTFSPTKQ